MTTRKSAAVRNTDCRCSVCGKKMILPQQILTIDNKRYCDACYRDCFFSNAKGRHRRTTDRCGI